MGNLKKHNRLGTEGQYDQSVCGMLFPKNVAGFWANKHTPIEDVCVRCQQEQERRKPPDVMSPLGHILWKEGGKMDMVILDFIDKHGRFPEVEDIRAALPYERERIQGHLSHLKRKHADFLKGILTDETE